MRDHVQEEEEGGLRSRIPCLPKKKHMTEEEKIEAHKLGQWRATAIAGNDITSSCLYVAGIATAAGGKFAPISLLLVALVLYLFRGTSPKHIRSDEQPLMSHVAIRRLHGSGQRTADEWRFIHLSAQHNHQAGRLRGGLFDHVVLYGHSGGVSPIRNVLLCLRYSDRCSKLAQYEY